MSLKLLHSESQNRWVSEVDGNYPTSGMPWEVSEFSPVRILYCSSSGSSVHGILQARILEWVAISFSRGSSWPRDRAPVSCVTDRFLPTWATRGAPEFYKQDFFSQSARLVLCTLWCHWSPEWKKWEVLRRSATGKVLTTAHCRRVLTEEEKRARSTTVGIKKGEKAGIYCG